MCVCVCACHISGAVRSGMNYSRRLYPGLVRRKVEWEKRREKKGRRGGSGKQENWRRQGESGTENEIVGFSLWQTQKEELYDVYRSSHALALLPWLQPPCPSPNSSYQNLFALKVHMKPILKFFGFNMNMLALLNLYGSVLQSNSKIRI